MSKFLYAPALRGPHWVDCADGTNYPPEGKLVPIRFVSVAQPGVEIKSYASWTNLIFDATELEALLESDEQQFYTAMRSTLWETINGITLESVMQWLHVGD